MLPAARQGKGEPALVMMPFLGGSHREWDFVAEKLRDRYLCVGVDLPGFGDARAVEGYSVEAMAEAVMATVAGLDLGRFVLVGHSMAGKVAAVVARCAAEGETRVAGLEGLVLVAPSPPGPEPMTEKKRTQMLDALGKEPGESEKAVRRAHEAAEHYIRENSAEDVAEEVFSVAVADVLRMDRAAWRAWLEGGSKEDWGERVGVLTLPVLLVAGDKDGSLGPEVQKTVSMPHWPSGRLASLHSNHLIPMEKPVELARLIGEFAAERNGEGVRATGPAARLGAMFGSRVGEVHVDPAYVELILSDRVSEPTRRVLEARAEGDKSSYEPQVVSITGLAQMRALVDRILPQQGVAIDLAARLDAQLAAGAGDGWRYGALPEDALAYPKGLATLEWQALEEFGVGWLGLNGEQQDELLARAAAGRLGRHLLARLEAVVGRGKEDRPALDAAQMQRWFEDVRAEATKIYMAHPATLARIGYSGIADGADSERLTGFVQLGEGVVEAWEPKARATATGGMR